MMLRRYAKQSRAPFGALLGSKCAPPPDQSCTIEWVAHPNRPAALLTYHAPALSVQVDLQQTIPECWSWFLMFLPGIFNI